MIIAKDDIGRLASTLKGIHDSLEDGQSFDFSKNKVLNVEKYLIENSPLPDNWRLRATDEENAKVLYPYFNKKYGHGWSVSTPGHHKIFLYGGKVLHRDHLYTGGRDFSCYKDHVEITPDFFIKNVIEKDEEYNGKK